MDDENKDHEERGVLYVKSMCMVCRNRTLNCPYCDGEGTSYIEAADRTIARWINNLSSQRKDDILKYITKD